MQEKGKGFFQTETLHLPAPPGLVSLTGLPCCVLEAGQRRPAT